MNTHRVALYFALFAWSLISVVGAEEWAESMFPAKRTHDFGTIAGRAKAEHEFRFTNNFEEEIRILDMKASCTCTSVWSKDKKRLFASGEEGAIIAHVNSDRFKGKKGATITVRFDVPSDPEIAVSEVRFQVRSNISDLSVEYDCVWFGPIDQGSEYEQTVPITVPFGMSVESITASVENEYLTAEVKRAEGRGKYVLRVTVAATAKPGLFPEIVTLVAQKRTGGVLRIPLSVVGEIRRAVSVTPSNLTLLVKAGETATKNLVVSSSRPVGIKAIHFADDRFQLKRPLSRIAKKHHFIPFTYVAGHNSGRSDSVIRVEFEGGEAPREIPAHVDVFGPSKQAVAGR